ncbi:helix-turn-helix domain-containing protein [Melioribacter sp. Ez-97]|jgi:transcriptional regulator with XRE-family HTH domain|uniref:ImmA/IrrE family metallo-endopeptidase n=1 Tax=Melioribacter sp. Ez-97 TaxID=3423434 RepID=UPI003ED902A0
MEKKLNIPLLTERSEELGLTQTSISKELGVSKEAVSQWFRGETFPRPQKLLSLGQLLDLNYRDIVIGKKQFEPVIAFRKVKNAKTSINHIKKAKEAGYNLEKLIKYLPFETVTKPPELINPSTEYNYIQTAVKVVKKKLDIKKITIDADDIIRCFNKYKTILIPVLLGSKKNHENALHIHLPESATNWVYINLDTKVFDFKFWLVHELGHIFTPSLKGEFAEDFSDKFAGAFLFPEEIAKKTYEQLKTTSSKKKNAIIFNLAKRYIISPYTILYEVEKYATHYKLEPIGIDKTFHANCNRFLNTYQLISENLFGTDKPTAEEYVEVVEREFETVFFNALRKLIKEEKVNYSYIRNVLNVSITDAKEIYTVLDYGLHKNTT